MTADDCLRLIDQGVEVDPRVLFTLAEEAPDWRRPPVDPIANFAKEYPWLQRRAGGRR